MSSNELTHHGIKGMRWGVRRYQNEDGSLTYSGKKRALRMRDQYTKFSKDKKYRDKDGNLTYSGRKKDLRMKERYSELTGKQLRGYAVVKNNQSKNVKKTNQKKISEMSDNELRDRINRINLEKQYTDLIKNADSINKQSEGKSFIKTVRSDVIKPVAIDLGRQALKSGGVKILNNLVKNPELKFYTNNKKKS